MRDRELDFSSVCPDRPYHAALVRVTEGWKERPVPHGHRDFCEMFYVTGGRGLQRLPAGDVELRPGHLAVIGPGDYHEFAATSGASLDFVNVAFSSSSWQSFTGLVLEPADGWLATPRSLLVSIRDEREEVEEAFQRALRAFNCFPTAVELARFWCQVVPHLTASRPKHLGEAGSPPPWLTRACQAMAQEDNLREGLPRLVELAAVSSSHLVRVMRRHYGCTPVAYVNEQRLALAAMLLATSTATVSEISSRCGFESASYFTRRFRQRYDVSPRAYRRQRQASVVPEDLALTATLDIASR
jgi:AraC family transcriptional regulator, dual regulator of chb operon